MAQEIGRGASDPRGRAFAKPVLRALLLSRDADDRFRTANELADALRQAARAERDTTDEADVAAWIDAHLTTHAIRDRFAHIVCAGGALAVDGGSGDVGGSFFSGSVILGIARSFRSPFPTTHTMPSGSAKAC